MESLLEEATALGRDNRYAEEIDLLTSALSIAPDCRKAYVKRANALRLYGRPEGALRDCERVLSLSSGTKQTSEGLLLRAETYEMLGNWRAALDDSLKVKVRNLTDSGRHMLWSTMGHCYYELGDLEKAAYFFSRALEMEPNISLTRVNRAVIYMKIGDYDRAIDDCEYVLRAEPDNEDALKYLRYLRKKVT
jgi:tetratricopeptide (TPR) repeat protein